MRICAVSDLYYPYPGGVSEHVHHTARELKKLDHKVTILTTNYGITESGEEDIVRVGRAIPRPTNKSMGIMPIGFGLSRKVKKTILDGRFDIIHMHGMSPFLPLLALRYSKSANIVTFHGSSPQIKLYKYIASLLQCYIRKVNGLIPVSKEALETLERFVRGEHTIVPTNGDSAGFIAGKFINARYKIIPNGIDTERFSPNIEPLPKFKSGGPNILFVGRFESRKGLKYLLEAFSRVRKEMPNARLIVVGKGRLSKIQTRGSWFLGTEGVLRQMVRKGLAGRVRLPAQAPLRSKAPFGSEGILGERKAPLNVYFEGYIPPEVLPRYYASCDVYCSPATGRESFGIVLLEAMSSGKPVIASNIPGYREVITDEENGILVEPENSETLANALIKVLKDNKLRARLAQKGRKTSMRYSWAKVSKEIEKFYYEIKNNKVENKKKHQMMH